MLMLAQVFKGKLRFGIARIHFMGFLKRIAGLLNKALGLIGVTDLKLGLHIGWIEIEHAPEFVTGIAHPSEFPIDQSQVVKSRDVGRIDHRGLFQFDSCAGKIVVFDVKIPQFKVVVGVFGFKLNGFLKETLGLEDLAFLLGFQRVGKTNLGRIVCGRSRGRSRHRPEKHGQEEDRLKGVFPSGFHGLELA